MVKNRKKIIIFISILTLLLILISVVIHISLRFSSNEKQIINAGENYIGISMLDENGDFLPSRNIKIEKDSIFKSKLSIANYIPMDRQYLLKIYDNEEFIDFSLDGRISKEHYLDMRKGEKQTFNLVINNITTIGKHDMVLFLVADPIENQFTDIERNMGRVITSRFNITYDQEVPQVNLSDNIDATNYYTDVFDDTFIFIATEDALTKNSDGIKIISRIIYKEEKHKFYLYMSNTTNKAMQYKIICLKNWRINNINNKSYLLVTIDSNSEIEIPVEVNINESDIGRELMFFQIPSPFESMDDNNIKKLGEENISIDIQNSTRMLIQKNNK